MKFAVIISRIFDPILLFTVTIILGAMRSGLTGRGLITFVLVLFFIMVLPPVVFLFWSIKTKRVSDIDVSNRRQRVRVLLVFGLFLILDYFVIKSFGHNSLETLFTSFIFWFAGFFVITLFWKISGHIAGLTLAIGLFIHWYGPAMTPLLILIPVVSWARVVTKNHTIMQTVFGALYSLFFLYETWQGIFR